MRARTPSHKLLPELPAGAPGPRDAAERRAKPAATRVMMAVVAALGLMLVASAAGRHLASAGTAAAAVQKNVRGADGIDAEMEALGDMEIGGTVLDDDNDDGKDDGEEDDAIAMEQSEEADIGLEANDGGALSVKEDDGYRGPRAETITIAHTGDTMISQNINLHVYGRGEYTYLWKSISHLWKDSADLVISNFEGTCAPLTGTVPRKLVTKVTKANFRTLYTSSNKKGGFNYPREFARQLRKDAGIDVMTLGNNHIFDRSVQGIGYTKRTLDDLGFLTIGVTDPDTVTSDEDIADPERWYKVVRRKGWKIALISCTTFPFGQNWAPYILYCEDVIRLLKDHIRPTHPDLDAEVVLPHWGLEFVVQTTAAQNELAKKWERAGITLILGNHPHVVQRAEASFNEAGERTSFTAYSLGGLMGGLGQISKEAARTRASAVLLTTLAKSADGESTIVQSATITPICEAYEPFIVTRGKYVKSVPTYSTNKCGNEERIVTQLLTPAAALAAPMKD